MVSIIQYFIITIVTLNTFLFVMIFVKFFKKTIKNKETIEKERLMRMCESTFEYDRSQSNKEIKIISEEEFNVAMENSKKELNEILKNKEKIKVIKTITQKELEIILKDHDSWLLGIENTKPANLDYHDLRENNLKLANLSLSGVSLEGANLSNLNLSGVRLSYANLENANISGANLSRTNLLGANLNNADLRGANTNLTIMRKIGNSNFKYTNLSRVIWCDNKYNIDLNDINLICAYLWE